MIILPAFTTYIICSFAGWRLAGERTAAARAQVRFSLIWLATVLPFIGLLEALPHP